ncbi:MAG: hypothetical protein Q4P78_07425 [Rothia sp. (in: high G+C Gram-positive bacteria)]|uniref:hypothetical protein n=1 Tax=Rothia sp. (in: high G+C Gram-positive bacteria) TaxID=1885016 RepID=UPI0026DFEFC5|nr:hypothetical protein [Rothia sp. (in: high G+C Gram-positive bacteria)]MDO5751008.1 hypothetical protein [Rothia sp. (in: high G+C Gram-positive bacteria)]
MSMNDNLSVQERAAIEGVEPSALESAIQNEEQAFFESLKELDIQALVSGESDAQEQLESLVSTLEESVQELSEPESASTAEPGNSEDKGE